MPGKRTSSAAKDEYTGSRAAYGVTEDDAPILTVEVAVERHPDWRAALEYMYVGDRYVLAEVRFFPAGDRQLYIDAHDELPLSQPVSLNVGQWSHSARALGKVRGNGISARMIRQLKFQEIDKVARLPETHRAVLPLLTGHQRDRWEAVIGEQAARPRSAGRDDAFYVGWALRYLECFREDSYRPYVLMSQRYGEKDIGRLRNYIDAAKRRGLFIGGRTQGARGGRLSKRGEAVFTNEESTK
jgi:hypothetical protein